MAACRSTTRNIVSLLFGLSILLGQGMVAGSQTRIVIKGSEEFLDAVTREGCDPSQLAQIMINNNLRTEQLAAMRADFPVYLFRGCSEKADAETAVQSDAIIAYLNLRATKAPEKAQSTTSAIKKDAGPSRKVQSSRIVKWIRGYGADIAIAAFIAIAFVVVWKFRKNVAGLFPKDRPHSSESRDVPFTIQDRLVTCNLPGCNVTDIPLRDALAHRERDHPEFRLCVDPIKYESPWRMRYENALRWIASKRKAA